jgi:hypothetical protein
MPWTVMGSGGPYHEDVEPQELDDGRLLLHSGRTLAKGTWQKFSAGDKPEVSRASVPPKAGRPERKDPADGFGENNTR